MGKQLFTRSRTSWVLIAVLGLSLPQAALALSEDASINQVTSGHVNTLDLVNLEIDANQLTLPVASPTCIATTSWRGRTFCAQYATSSGPLAPTDVAGDMSASDDNRFYVDPTEGYAAMRLELGISLLKSEVDRIDISAEVAQSHAGRPVQAFIFNHSTGLFEASGSYVGTADGMLRHTIAAGASNYVSGSQTLTMLLVNADQGIRSGSVRARDGMYIDLVNISVADGQMVPEPTAAILTGLGLLGLTLATRRRD
jgi:hypothetical protein